MYIFCSWPIKLNASCHVAAAYTLLLLIFPVKATHAIVVLISCRSKLFTCYSGKKGTEG